MDIVYIVAGLVLLFVGGEGLIRGSVTISKKFGISPILIGVVIVGFGTSTPELLVSVEAALQNQPAIALGNIVGSNIANIMLIMALAALITPLLADDSAIRRDALIMVAASVQLMAVVPLGEITRPIGALMVAGILGYVVYAYRKDQAERLARAGAEGVHEKEVHEFEAPKTSLPISLAMAGGGIALLMLGADWLITGATAIARSYGVPEAIIGLTLVAVGTSLPELAASIVGAVKRETDVVIGNILGSNMYNILGILGIASIIKPIPIDPRMAAIDIPVMLGVAIGTTIVIFMAKKFGRVTGGICLALYIGYVWWMFKTGVV